MWITKLCYLLFLVGLTIFYVLYIDPLALTVLLAALLLPVMLKICLLWLKFSSCTSLACHTDSCHADESVPVCLVVENRCPLFFPKAYAAVSIRHVFGKKAETIRLKFPLHNRNTTRLTFYVKADYCGALEISLKEVKVLDYFHIFRTKLKKQDATLELLVLPQQLRIPLSAQAEAVYEPESNFYADKPGDDPSEIFDIREYRAGDAVSRIHWKLSSKSEDVLFVKECSFPVEKHVLLIAEYLTEPDVNSVHAEHALHCMKQAQAMLTVLYSVVAELETVAEQTQMHCTVLWYDSRQQTCVQQEMTSLQDLQSMFRALYCALPHMKMDAGQLHDRLFGQQFSSVTMFTNDTSCAILSMLEQDIQANQKNLLIISENPEDVSAQVVDSVHLQVIPSSLLTAEHTIPELVI